MIYVVYVYMLQCKYSCVRYFNSLLVAKSAHSEKNEWFLILVPPANLTRQSYPGGLCLLLTCRWRQIFNDLDKVKGEDASEGADLSPSPVLSNTRLQLDHIPLRERQLITVLPIKVEPCHASWTTLGEATTFQVISSVQFVKASANNLGC